MRHYQFIRRFKSLNRRLLDWGWLFGGMMANYEVQAIEEMLTKYDEARFDSDRSEILQTINELMLRHVFAPNVRAYTVFRAFQEPSTKSIAHHIEMATFHYYKQNFFLCVLTLLPAVEGLLLARAGWSVSSPSMKPKFKRLIANLEASEAKIPPLTARFEVHKEALVAFMQKWLFEEHRAIDPDISLLNRHYALHCMGDDSFYTAADCHQLFTFLDVYLEFAGYETGYGFRAFIPDDEPFINQRQAYYVSLFLGDACISDVARREEAFMCQHAAYKAENNPPNWQRISEKSARDIPAAMERAARAAREGV